MIEALVLLCERNSREASEAFADDLSVVRVDQEADLVVCLGDLLVHLVSSRCRGQGLRIGGRQSCNVSASVESEVRQHLQHSVVDLPRCLLQSVDRRDDLRPILMLNQLGGVPSLMRTLD